MENPSIPPLPINNIDHPLPLLPPIQIHLQHLKRAIHVRLAQPADVRRDDAIGRVPQGVIFW